MNSLFSGLQENEYVLGYVDFVDIFGGSSQIGLYIGVISMHLRVFFKIKVQNGGYFGGLVKFQIFLGDT